MTFSREGPNKQSSLLFPPIQNGVPSKGTFTVEDEENSILGRAVFSSTFVSSMRPLQIADDLVTNLDVVEHW